MLLTGELTLDEPGACCFGLAGQQGLRTLLSATQPQHCFSRYMCRHVHLYIDERVQVHILILMQEALLPSEPSQLL